MSFMKQSRHVVALLSSLTLVAACSAYDGAEMKAAVQTGELDPQARNCPSGDCEPPPPPDDDPPPPPPPRPEQPDPAKLRIIDIPAEFVAGVLNFALADTVVQASHTDGESLAFPGTVHTCHSEPNDNKAECLEMCKELEIKLQGACRAQCDKKPVCNYFCSNTATSSLNFIRWGQAAKAFSGTKSCSPTTCPTCSTPTTISSLDDEELPVPLYRRKIASIPGLSYVVTCKMNRFRFHGDARSIAVTSSADGIRVRLPGETGSPSVICSNAPDVTVHDPAVQLRFSFPYFSLHSLRVDADLQGDVDTEAGPAGPVIDFVGDVEDRLKAKFHEVAGNRLNQDKFKPMYQQLLLTLIDRYISANQLSPLSIPGRIETRGAGIHFQYWTN